MRSDNQDERLLIQIVALHFWEHHEFAQIVGQPGGIIGDEYAACFDLRSLCCHAHNLVAVYFDGNDMCEAFTAKFLIELGPGGSILDKHRPGLELLCQEAQLALEFRVIRGGRGRRAGGKSPCFR